MEHEMNNLLSELCINWGFCILIEDKRRIAAATHFHAKDFAKEVIQAEGMNPEIEVVWVRRISDKFIERFGTHEIDEDTFEGKINGPEGKWKGK
ncbi:MAG: hypothetical protein AAGI38_21310 [Bacteroidota bacterium]